MKKTETVVAQCVRLFATPWTVARQAPLSMGFSRQEFWSGLPFPSPGDPYPRIEPESPALQADSLPSKLPGKPESPPVLRLNNIPLYGYITFFLIHSSVWDTWVSSIF